VLPWPAVAAGELGRRSGIGVGVRSALARAVPQPAFGAVLRAVYPRIEPELACIADWAPRGGTALDVGVWYGPWTARMGQLAARVVSIEPNPDLARLLRASFPAVQVIEAAASDRTGTARLWLPDGGRGAEGVASLEHPSDRSVEVSRVTIDSLDLADVRFIKMDIEGHEAAALRGAEHTIRRDSPMLLLELETRHQRIEDVTGLLASWGYRGMVRPGRSWVPLDGFDLAAHQQASLHVAERGMLGRLALSWLRPATGRYVNLVRFERVSPAR
jgi:FkbM family methyltransferase